MPPAPPPQPWAAPAFKRGPCPDAVPLPRQLIEGMPPLDEGTISKDKLGELVSEVVKVAVKLGCRQTDVLDAIAEEFKHPVCRGP